MIDTRLLLHFVVVLILLGYGEHVYKRFLKQRTNFNLVKLVIVIILFAGTILNYIFPSNLTISNAIQMIIIDNSILFFILVAAIFFYFGFDGYVIFRYWRTKSYVVPFTVFIILFTCTLLIFLLPAKIHASNLVIDSSLLLSLIAAEAFLYFSLRTYSIYRYSRTKYNLAMLIISIVIFIGVILGYFYPLNLNLNGTEKALIFIAFVLLLFGFLFYQEIKRFFTRLNKKS